MQDPLKALILDHNAKYTAEKSSKFLQWQRIHSQSKQMPRNRSGSASAIIGRCLYIFGGFHHTEALNDLWILDLDTFQWTEITQCEPIPSPRTSHSMVADPVQGYLYVLCGSGSTFGHTNLGDVWRFDVLSRKWTNLTLTGDKIEPRYGQSAVWYDSSIYVFGGTFGRHFSREFFRINLNSLECTKIPLSGDVPCPRYKHDCDLLPNGKMLLHGGASHLKYDLGDTFIYDFAKQNWTELRCNGDLPPGQFAHTIKGHPSNPRGKAWMFGGCDRNSCFDSLYCFELDLNKWTRLKVSQGLPKGRYFHVSAFDPLSKSLLVFSGKGSIDSPVRFNDLHRIFIDDLESFCSPIGALGNDLLSMLFEEDMVDTAIHSVDGVSFPCHRVILESRCPRFEETEKLMASSEAVAHLIYFLYCDKLSTVLLSTALYLELLHIALQLDLFRLRDLIELKLLSQMMTGKFTQNHFQLVKSMDQNLRICQWSTLAFTSVSSTRRSVQMKLPLPTLSYDISRLKLGSVPFDYSIRLENGSVHRVHLLVLAARSDFFRSQCLRSFMAEASESECNLMGVPSKVLEYILDLIYEREFEGVVDHELVRFMISNDLCNFFGFTFDITSQLCKSRT